MPSKRIRGGRSHSEGTTPRKRYDYNYSTNEQMWTKESIFSIACELAGIQPTKRQLSKFRNKHGEAYAFRPQAVLEMSRRNTLQQPTRSDRSSSVQSSIQQESSS